MTNASVDHDPDSVKIGGHLYVKTLSALGIPYFYSISAKTAIWRLPVDFVVEGSDSGKDSRANFEAELDSLAEEFETENEDTSVQNIPGFPDWRKVDRGDGNPYYFHVITEETRWEYPIKN